MSSNTHTLMRLTGSAYMKKKFKLPKMSKKEIEELTRACKFAYGDPSADEFFDEVMASARAKRKLRLELCRQQPGNQ